MSMNLISIIYNIMVQEMDMNFIHKTCHAMSIEENAQMVDFAMARLDEAKRSNADDAYARQCDAENIADLAQWHYEKKMELFHAPLV